ncbi:hypothetical protein [Methylomonas methanica]|uniref:D-alanine transfer protein n=1 Tax=Methylomonas methanica (strain DSM 25384 / MC09) TaxID=857087 RepID=F9ZWD2_METMM|nr:hypothetical protein [Methylomonas methanica]AEF99601.1 hypothetical protein Metme_1173 [Methylomonas methanica MC09]
MIYSFSNFLVSAGVIFTLSLATVAGINYHYDPANIFSDRTYEAGVGRLLSEGKDVGNVTDFDERLVQKFFAERLKSRRDVLVIGSSRAMNLESKHFSGKSYYNASVSGASMEDYYAILQIYRDINKLPKLLVLGVDPWVFNRNNEQTRWKSLEQEYLRSVKENESGQYVLGPAIEWQFSKLQQLFSFDYLRTSLKYSHREDRDYYVTTAAELDVNIHRADGTITYKREFSHRSSEQVADWVRKQLLKTPLYSLGGYKELDLAYIKQFEALILNLYAEGTKVILFLAPYHPDFYKVMNDATSPYRRVIDAEDYLYHFAETHKFPIFGSYNPRRIPCSRGDFFDEMHPRPICIDKIFKNKVIDLGRL